MIVSVFLYIPLARAVCCAVSSRLLRPYRRLLFGSESCVKVNILSDIFGEGGLANDVKPIRPVVSGREDDLDGAGGRHVNE